MERRAVLFADPRDADPVRQLAIGEVVFRHLEERKMDLEGNGCENGCEQGRHDGARALDEAGRSAAAKNIAVSDAGWFLAGCAAPGPVAPGNPGSAFRA